MNKLRPGEDGGEANPCIRSGRARVEARRLPQAARDFPHCETETAWRGSRYSGVYDILFAFQTRNAEQHALPAILFPGRRQVNVKALQ